MVKVDGYEIGPKANLKGADLRGANLQGADLHGASLEGANLRGAGLTGANLWGANLVGANLVGANLWRADLRAANLVGADLVGANLRGADLWKADLRRANLEMAIIERAILERAYGISNRVIVLGTRSDGYQFLLTRTEPGPWRIKAGCRNFTLDEARCHWDTTRPKGSLLGDETRLLISTGLQIAKMREWPEDGAE